MTTLTPITHHLPMMDRGLFSLFHAWDADGYRVEYWRGMECNGAVVRVLHDGGALRCVHFQKPGLALHELRMWGYSIPGVAPAKVTRQPVATPLAQFGAA